MARDEQIPTRNDEPRRTFKYQPPTKHHTYSMGTEIRVPIEALLCREVAEQHSRNAKKRIEGSFVVCFPEES